MGDHRETDWLIPATSLTAGAALAALVMMRVSGFSGQPPFLELIPKWMIWTALCLLVALIGLVLHFMLSRVGQPAAKLREMGRVHGKRIAFAGLGTALAGINLVTYMWLKPQLDYLAPFWLDGSLATIDVLIIGQDGWRLFSALNTEFVATTYSPVWFMALVPALLFVFLSPPSRERTASIISYFLLWSVFGPVGQYLMSAAGPIFYERLELGAQFNDFEPTVLAGQISDYLWDAYTDKALITGAGISAMPSLHVATVFWATISFAGLRSKLTPLVAIFALYMWIASVALGWHYLVDGIVGGAMAVIAYMMVWMALGQSISRPFRPLASA